MTPILTITLNPALDIAASVDTIVVGPKLRCEGGQIDAGGGGVNVSRVVQEMDADCKTFVATAGDTGNALVNRMKACGLDPVRFETEGETRQSISVFEESTGKQLRLVLPGPVWDKDDNERLMSHLSGLIEPDTIVVASGSLPPGVPDDFYVHLNKLITSRSGRMVLDTSGSALDCAVEHVDAPYAVLRMDRLEAEDLAKQTFETAQSMADYARGMVNNDVAETVIFARGDEGSVFVTSTEKFLIRPPKVPARSKVGAGDSFVGALVASMAKGYDLQTSGRLATGAASAAVQTEATDLCKRQDIEDTAVKCETIILE